MSIIKIHYQIGYIPHDLEWRNIRYFAGISIPTFIEKEIYRLKIRRLSENSKCRYIQISGSDGKCLFNANDVLLYPDIVFTEGEFDAMIINQELKKIGENRIRAATFGSAQSRPNVDTYYRYFRMPTRISVCYDNDKAGINGANELAKIINKIDTRKYRAEIKTLPDTKIKDWNDYQLNGGNIPKLLRNWFPIYIS